MSQFAASKLQMSALNHNPSYREEALAFFDLQDKKKWNDLAVSAGMLIAYRLLFLLILKVKEWR